MQCLTCPSMQQLSSMRQTVSTVARYQVLQILAIVDAEPLIKFLDLGTSKPHKH